MALNRGIGSSSLNAEVKAFDRLSLRAPAAKYNWCDSPRQELRTVQVVVDEPPVYDQLGCCIGELLCACHISTWRPIDAKFLCMRPTPIEMA